MYSISMAPAKWIPYPDIKIKRVDEQMIPADHQLSVNIQLSKLENKYRILIEASFLTFSHPAYTMKSEPTLFQPAFRRQVRSWFKQLKWRAMNGSRIARRHLFRIENDVPIDELNLVTGYYGHRPSTGTDRIWKFALHQSPHAPKDIRRFIAAVRNSLHNSVDHYTKGNCYGFALLLRSQYPEAVIWYDHIEGHVYTRIGSFWYDIRGMHFRRGNKCPLDHREGNPPHRWKPCNV